MTEVNAGSLVNLKGIVRQIWSNSLIMGCFVCFPVMLIPRDVDDSSNFSGYLLSNF